MKYFVLAGPGLLVLVLTLSTINLFFQHFRGRYAAQKAINQGMGTDAPCPEGVNEDFAQGWAHYMYLVIQDNSDAADITSSL